MADKRVVNALGWFIVGAAVGTAAGLLLAPKRGEETREDISDWLLKKREQTRELATRLKETIPARKEQLIAAVKAGKEALHIGDHKKEPIAA